jgi:peroxiredoxin Q/BCP
MKTLFFVVFLIWGLPMMKYRSQFRKIVYQTDDWRINIQPKFGREIKGLFTNLYPDNAEYLKARNFYLFYLGVYTLLFILWRYCD